MSKRAGGKKSRRRRGGYQKHRFELRVVEKEGARETPQAKLEREAAEAGYRQSEMHRTSVYSWVRVSSKSG